MNTNKILSYFWTNPPWRIQKYELIRDSLAHALDPIANKRTLTDERIKQIFSLLHKNIGFTRNDYQQIIKLFRIVFHDAQPTNRWFLPLFAKALYSIDTQPFSKQVFEALCGTSQEKDPLKKTEIHHHSLQKCPQENLLGLTQQISAKLHGGLKYFTFDPQMQGNPAYISFVTNKCKVLHLGCPTRNAKVSEEFQAYISALGKKNHIYINLQDGRPVRQKIKDLWMAGKFYEAIKIFIKMCVLLIGHERNRVIALQKFSTTHKNFILYSFEKNSSFYHQYGTPKKMPWKHFKQQFIHRMFEAPNSGFILPPQKKEKFSHILRQVKALFFPNKNKLTQDERKDFIEIAYTFFMADLIQGTKNVESCNLTCKEAVDRGATSNALLFQLLSPKQGNLDEITLFPALWGRKRSMEEEKWKRFHSASKRIQNHSSLSQKI
ncbi:MAG: hypothetical protein WCP39_07380 [Chlamydiota bacterium]